MNKIIRHDINEDYGHAGLIEAGNQVYVNYCVGNIGQDIESQVRGAVDHLEERLGLIDLTLSSVVKLDCLFHNIYDIPVMEKVIKERFMGIYPVRKSIETNFAHPGGTRGILFQLDAIAYKEG